MKRKAWACQHTDRPNRGRGLCGSCYDRAWFKDPKRPRATACEHTDRPNAGRGLCKACHLTYRRKLVGWGTKNVKAWECPHIDQPHLAFGLCRECHGRYKRYGITPAIFESITKKYGTYCGILGCKNKWAVIDHIEKGSTVIVRGLLCRRHNLALHIVDEVGIEALAEYVRRVEFATEIPWRRQKLQKTELFRKAEQK